MLTGRHVRIGLPSYLRPTKRPGNKQDQCGKMRDRSAGKRESSGSRDETEYASGTPSGDREDDQGVSERELLDVLSTFNDLNRELDLLVGSEADRQDAQFMSLHAEWSRALSRATELPARTAEGWRAKAAMLLVAMSVILGEDHERSPHELLAESLARDLTACGNE